MLPLVVGTSVITNRSGRRDDDHAAGTNLATTFTAIDDTGGTTLTVAVNALPGFYIQQPGPDARRCATGHHSTATRSLDEVDDLTSTPRQQLTRSLATAAQVGSPATVDDEAGASC